MKFAANNYKIDNEYIDIKDEDWKFLVILDACRYDFFEEVYKEFFNDVVLKKAISPARHTLEWLCKTFDNYYDDTIYISGNPWVNSFVINKKFKFHAKKHFYKIVDVWNFGWDNSLGTIPPREININFTKQLLKNKNKRFILHYNQPHQPYISLGGFSRQTRRFKKHDPTETFKNKVKFLISKTVGDRICWELFNILNISFKDYGYMLYKKYGGFDEIRRAYKNDLRIVLEKVKLLTDNIPGSWLITADHGELLGEHNGYDHCHYLRYKELVEVPYLKFVSNPKN